MFWFPAGRHLKDEQMSTMEKRVIKFRVWHREHKRMHEVSGLGLSVPIVLWRMEDGENGPAFQLRDCELMQYINLKDKNGKDAYEGDVVKHIDATSPCVIEFEGGHFFAAEKDNMHCAGFDLDKTGFEIIGNIYEHPELLK